MTCRDSESLILAERDGALTKEQSAALSDHVAACPSCQRLRADLAAALTAFKSDIARVPVPDVDEAWRDLQSRLHAPARRSKKSPLAPVIWFGSSLAAAAAVALVFMSPSQPTAVPQEPISPVVASATTRRAPPPPPPPLHDPSIIAGADYVEAGDPNASTMVYVDKESGWLVVWATNVADTNTSG